MRQRQSLERGRVDFLLSGIGADRSVPEDVGALGYRGSQLMLTIDMTL